MFLQKNIDFVNPVSGLLNDDEFDDDMLDHLFDLLAWVILE